MTVRVFVTGSADGLGRMAAALLAAAGHRVVLHARSEARARDARAAVPGAETAVVGDLSRRADLDAMAARLDALGPLDAVIHNAAVGFREKRRVETADGFAHVFAVNTLAPYLLTARLRHRPARLVFMSSELHRRGDASLADPNWEGRPWRGNQAYCDTKLHMALMAAAISRRWPAVRSNSVEPGWVATRMGGAHATGDLEEGHRTQAWLATAPDATATGGHFFHMRPKKPAGPVTDPACQDRLLALCEQMTGVPLPP